ncbi:MAG: gliding motility-associated C-terminal domain-containing protein [Saprospiraceae bacterium]
MNQFKLLCSLLAISTAMFFHSCSTDDESSKGSYTASCCEIDALTANFDSARVFVPNVFTPNGDGINDLLFILINNKVARIDSFIVRNQRGESVFKNTDFYPTYEDDFWDGSLLDGSIDNGIFNYFLTISSINEISMSFTGEVCVRAGLQPECVDSEANCIYGVQHDGEGAYDLNIDTSEILCE